jgi:hypothetical protein
MAQAAPTDFRALHARFKKEYGDPSVPASNPTWYGDKVILSVYPHAGKVEISDRPTTEKYGAELIELMRGKGGHGHSAGKAGDHGSHEGEADH